MKVVLVNPPNHLYDLAELAPPLGLMCLASVGLNLDWEVVILDLSLPVWAELGNYPEKFYERVTNLLLGECPDLVAVTTMGVNSHVGLEILKRARDSGCVSWNAVGGVHFGSIATSLATIAPWIDFVIQGSGEGAFAELLELVPRLYKKDRGRLRALRSSGESELSHPHRAYNLVGLDDYFGSSGRRLVNYENERGCIYKCAFCYSTEHHQSSLKRISPARIADDLNLLKARGASHAFFVQDNFLNDPTYAREILNEITCGRAGLTWDCYVSAPNLNAELGEKMALAGCTEMYLGLDAVDPGHVRQFNKRFYKGSRTIELMATVASFGVMPTCAFIVDVYRWDPVGLEAVLRTVAQCAYLGFAVRINTFTRYPGTALACETRGASVASTAKVELMMDCPRVVVENRFASDWPSEFPFHSTEIEPEEWERRLLVVHVAQNLIQHHPEFFVDLIDGDHSVVSFINRVTDELEPMRDQVPKVRLKATEREIFERLIELP